MKSSIQTVAFAIFGISVSFCARSQDSFTNGLIAYYTFEGNGNDVSGNGNNSTPSGNYQYIQNGLSGTAIRIIGDGSIYYSGGGHILLPSFTSNLNSGFTCSLWVKDESIGVEPVGAESYVSFQNGSADSAFRSSIGLNNWDPAFVGFFNGNGSGLATDFRYQINMASYPPSWKHLVMVSAPGRFSAYINGSKAFETNVSYNVFPAPLSALGRKWWASGSSARMSVTYDNVRIYSRALSDLEVSQLYSIESTQLPYLTIRTKTIQLSLYVQLGKTYQIETSTDMQTWTTYGSPFVAIFSPVNQDVDVLEGSRFFRIKEVLN